MARMLVPRITAVLAFVVLALAPAGAQEPGQGGAQQPQEQDAAPAPAPAPAAPARDYREEMRRFIQAIGAFARRNRRDFLIIPQNGLELLTKVDAIDSTKRAPARTYMRSIDGVLQEALYFGDADFGDPDFDKPTPAERQEKLLKLTDLARTNGLRVLVMDYGRKAKTVNGSHRRNAARGYVPFVAHARAQELGSLPRYPRRPFHENGASVLSLKTVRNFLYLRNSAPFGRQEEFTMTLRGTNFDLVVVDVFHGRTPLTKRAVEGLKYKKTGARRLVLAYMDIGSAARYRHYWKPTWREGSPRWIGGPFYGDPDRYYVRYWRAAWQKIITGDTQSYVFGIIDLGFDGVVLGGVDAYRYFESGGELEIERAGQ
ncbi:MAG: hypothetical protein ACE5FR_13935 [Rhodospirillales bacterium]